MPHELLLLKDDVIISVCDEKIITKWDSIKPRSDFAGGVSCYFLQKNYKISKFFTHDGSFLYYYCDIGKMEKNGNNYIFSDLLADIVIYPDGSTKVLDLDEMAEALRKGLITQDDMLMALDALDGLLKAIYNKGFCGIASVLDGVESYGE